MTELPQCPDKYRLKTEEEVREEMTVKPRYGKLTLKYNAKRGEWEAWCDGVIRSRHEHFPRLIEWAGGRFDGIDIKWNTFFFRPNR